jgi:hypothetical protein
MIHSVSLNSDERRHSKGFAVEAYSAVARRPMLGIG